MTARTSPFFLGVVIVAALATSAEAQWQHDGVPVCTASGFQSAPTAVPDGSGGTIIAWVDERSSPFRIYAQHLDSTGVSQWTANGAPLCSSGGPQYYPAAISDGLGGAIVAW